ncbi:MAG: biopolymer transporter ExbD [Blastochloris sp.]|nr:biopolymer transporter ExbD [Blastochloris sp.]
MQIHLEEEQTAELPIVAMIDVAFLLLVFFLVATTLKKPDEKVPEVIVDLPQSAISLSPNAQKQMPTVITVNKDGQFFINAESVSQQALHERLKEIAKNAPQTRIRIDGDREARYQQIIQALELCQFEGLHNVGFHTAGEK